MSRVKAATDRCALPPVHTRRHRPLYKQPGPLTSVCLQVYRALLDGTHHVAVRVQPWLAACMAHSGQS